MRLLSGLRDGPWSRAVSIGRSALQKRPKLTIRIAETTCSMVYGRDERARSAGMGGGERTGGAWIPGTGWCFGGGGGAELAGKWIGFAWHRIQLTLHPG